MISNEEELAACIGCDVSRIAKALFKGTVCGVSYDSTETGITLLGIAEGSDVECPVHTLTYPFEPEIFWGALSNADMEGVALWDDTHVYET